MRQLVADDALELLAIELLQQARRDRDRGVLGIAAGGERVRGGVVDDVDAPASGMLAAIAISWTTFNSCGAAPSSTSLAPRRGEHELVAGEVRGDATAGIPTPIARRGRRRRPALGVAVSAVADREAEGAEQHHDDAPAGTSCAGWPRSGRRTRPGPRSLARGRRDQLRLRSTRDVRRLGLGVEELALGEAERAREQHVRERRDRGVVVEDARVVVLAREGDLVLGRRQLLLELSTFWLALSSG